jgi:hypothetical protein
MEFTSHYEASDDASLQAIPDAYALFYGDKLIIAFFVRSAKWMSYNGTPHYCGVPLFSLYEARTESKLYRRQRLLAETRHDIRRTTQALYLYYAPGRELPPPGVRLRPQDYDKVAAERVTWALGHSRRYD